MPMVSLSCTRTVVCTRRLPTTGRSSGLWPCTSSTLGEISQTMVPSSDTRHEAEADARLDGFQRATCVCSVPVTMR